MTDMVRVRVIRALEDMRVGDGSWVEETSRVRGMVAGGYWEIVDRQPMRVRTRKAEVVDDGADQAEPS